VCDDQNINQLMYMLYRPLYWYGNNYRPTIDYDYSNGQTPQFSGGGQTVTIKLNSWKWADGESVTSRDLVFWMNLIKANPAEWCGYVPGYFPDNVISYSAPNPSTFVLHFSKAYSPTWVTYDELSQLTPIPLAWDRTSLSQPGRRPTMDISRTPRRPVRWRYTSSSTDRQRIWAPGHRRRCVRWSTGRSGWRTSHHRPGTMVPNPDYSGSPKRRSPSW
jgi:peptide/nickel transport system substrate-binding protein